MKLLTDTTGKKMGKSEGNMVALNDTPEDIFGKVMSWADSMIIKGFELCTKISMEEIGEMSKGLKKDMNPRDLKLRLAGEVVKTFLGEVAAKKAEAHFVSTFSKRETPTDIPKIKPSAYDIVTVLIESKICASKSDARRVIEQGGVKINGGKVFSFDAKVKKGDVIQKGSRWFAKVL
jgi:tyrosyl-tRNA synthetase